MPALAQKTESWVPHLGAQTEFLQRAEFEVLFGGAAGPGKTDCLVAAMLKDIRYPNYHGLLIRRTFPQLQEIIDDVLVSMVYDENITDNNRLAAIKLVKDLSAPKISEGGAADRQLGPAVFLPEKHPRLEVVGIGTDDN